MTHWCNDPSIHDKDTFLRQKQHFLNCLQVLSLHTQKTPSRWKFDFYEIPLQFFEFLILKWCAPKIASLWCVDEEKSIMTILTHDFCPGLDRLYSRWENKDGKVVWNDFWSLIGWRIKFSNWLIFTNYRKFSSIWLKFIITFLLRAFSAYQGGFVSQP